MRALMEVLGAVVFIGLVGLGVWWAVDNVQIKSRVMNRFRRK